MIGPEPLTLDGYTELFAVPFELQLKKSLQLLYDKLESYTSLFTNFFFAPNGAKNTGNLNLKIIL